MLSTMLRNVEKRCAAEAGHESPFGRGGARGGYVAGFGCLLRHTGRAGRFAAGTLLLVWAAGCGGGARLQPVTSESVVLAFGDSLTSGVGAEEEESYPAVLARLLGCRVVNSGVAGEITREGLARLPELLRRHRPQMVIICFGGNDMLRKLNDEEIARNLREMIRVVRQAEADVVLLGVPQPGLLLRAPPFYREIAEELDLVYEGVIVPRILSTPSQKSDLIHPNADGYRRLAERLAKVIRQAS
jgi:lysophospholipase L1-like esterase